MASLTIRKLDEAIRDELRLRAASNGRSVEDEVRVILREASQSRPSATAAAWSALLRPRSATPPRMTRGIEPARVTLIIGGGIAAYKALDLIRRLKERAHSGPLRADQGRAAVRHPADRQRAVATSAATPTCSIRESEFDAGHIRLARDCDLIVVAPATADLMAKMAQRPCRRSRHRHPARGQPADPAGAGDEPADVEQCRDPPQRRAARTRWRRHDRPQCRRNGRSRRGRHRPDGRAAGNRRRRRAHAASAATAPAGRQARPDYRRPDP